MLLSTVLLILVPLLYTFLVFVCSAFSTFLSFWLRFYLLCLFVFACSASFHFLAPFWLRFFPLYCLSFFAMLVSTFFCLFTFFLVFPCFLLLFIHFLPCLSVCSLFSLSSLALFRPLSSFFPMPFLPFFPLFLSTFLLILIYFVSLQFQGPFNVSRDYGTVLDQQIRLFFVLFHIVVFSVCPLSPFLMFVLLSSFSFFSLCFCFSVLFFDYLRNLDYKLIFPKRVIFFCFPCRVISCSFPLNFCSLVSRFFLLDNLHIIAKCWIFHILVSFLFVGSFFIPLRVQSASYYILFSFVCIQYFINFIHRCFIHLA